MTVQVEKRHHIRWMVRRDMPEVLHIETSCYNSPWCEEDFLRCLRQRNSIGMVVEEGFGKIVGFMIYELHKTKLSLLNFSVHPEFRHKEIGTKMIQKLQSKLASHRRKAITLWVRESNLAAQLFLREMDFKALQVCKNYYNDTDEDGYFMRYLHLDNLAV